MAENLMERATDEPVPGLSSLLTIKETAGALRTTVGRVRMLVAQGRLSAVPMGDRIVRFEPAAVRECVRRLSTPTTTPAPEPVPEGPGPRPDPDALARARKARWETGLSPAGAVVMPAGMSIGPGGELRW